MNGLRVRTCKRRGPIAFLDFAPLVRAQRPQISYNDAEVRRTGTLFSVKGLVVGGKVISTDENSVCQRSIVNREPPHPSLVSRGASWQPPRHGRQSQRHLASILACWALSAESRRCKRMQIAPTPESAEPIRNTHETLTLSVRSLPYLA